MTTKKTTEDFKKGYVTALKIVLAMIEKCPDHDSDLIDTIKCAIRLSDIIVPIKKLRIENDE